VPTSLRVFAISREFDLLAMDTAATAQASI